MTRSRLDVAVPWNLGHYLAMGGVPPLYRALFDHAPPWVEMHAWDTVRLHNLLGSDPAAGKKFRQSADSHTARIAREHLPDEALILKANHGVGNCLLTRLLPGDIELFHTIPFPSFDRPFILICEHFFPGLPRESLPEDGSGSDHEAFRRYYRSVLSNRLCLAVVSHIPETLERIRCLLGDPALDSKLHLSMIGLSPSLELPTLGRAQSLSAPVFLYMEEVVGSPQSFFSGGGHIVLGFWERFRKTRRQGKLILHAPRPSEMQLTACGVDTSFVRTEMGKSIYWFQDYLSEQ
ncbi:MAG: hypothetical protein V1793_06525 [Pseudomonadota bacterium]